jgi:hypothetical protein
MLHLVVPDCQRRDDESDHIPVDCLFIQDIDDNGVGEFGQVQAEVGVLDIHQGLQRFLVADGIKAALALQIAGLVGFGQFLSVRPLGRQSMASPSDRQKPW